MKKLRKFAAIASGMALVGGIAITSAPAANATNYVDCAGRNDFYELISPDGWEVECYANYGDYGPISWVTQTLSTGNNVGWVTYDQLGSGYYQDSPERPAWYVGSFSQAVEVVSVHIR